MSRNEVLCDAAPWPRRQEEAPAAFFQVGRVVSESDDPFEKYDERIVQSQIAKIAECRSQIVKFDNLIAGFQETIKQYEDFKQQEFDKITKAEVAIAKMKALKPPPLTGRVVLSAQAQLFGCLKGLYFDSSSSRQDVTFSINPSVLDECASDRTIVGTTTTGPDTAAYCRGVFGRTAFYAADFTVADVVQRSREMSGKTFNVQKNELGLV
jgi:hypothetical protein